MPPPPLHHLAILVLDLIGDICLILCMRLSVGGAVFAKHDLFSSKILYEIFILLLCDDFLLQKLFIYCFSCRNSNVSLVSGSSALVFLPGNFGSFFLG